MNMYAEYGAIGVIVSLFVLMITNLIKSQKLQNEDLDQIRQANAKLETKMANVESIILKMLDRWNRSDETSQRHREDIVKELNDVSDDLNFIKGRMNGRSIMKVTEYRSEMHDLLVQVSTRQEEMIHRVGRIEKHLEKINGKVAEHEASLIKIKTIGMVAVFIIPLTINIIMRLI